VALQRPSGERLLGRQKLIGAAGPGATRCCVLGDGVRLFDDLETAPVELEQERVVDAPA
jgi:hypothetical protein